MLSSRPTGWLARTTGPHLRALTVCFGALAAVSLVLLLSARLVSAQDGETALVLDVDTALEGVQAERAAPIAVGDTFHVRAVLRSLGPDVYGAYQVSITYPAASLEPVGLPDNWGDEPTAETGGNLLQFTSGALCDPSPTRNSISPVIEGIGAVALTCAELDFAETTSNTGDLVDVVFRCIAPGAVSLGLSTVDNTFILDAHLLPDGGIYGDVFEGATAQCEGQALTATPAAAETATQQPAGTPASSTTSDASPDGTAPNPTDAPSSAGDDDDDGGTPWALIIIIAIVAVVAVGGGLLFAARRRAP